MTFGKNALRRVLEFMVNEYMGEKIRSCIVCALHLEFARIVRREILSQTRLIYVGVQEKGFLCKIHEA
jgi:hypothetical protein